MKRLRPGTWRYSAWRTIVDALTRLAPHYTPGDPWRDGEAARRDVRRAIEALYPFTERKYLPYKVWGEEVRAALGYAHEKPAKRAAADAEAGLFTSSTKGSEP